MTKQLSQEKKDKYDKILTDSSINAEVKSQKLTNEEAIELKAYAIKKAVKIKTYVRD